MADSYQLTTPLGPVRGGIIKTARDFPIYSFQGIPYAKPPVGELRLKNPVPIEPWTEVVDARNAPPPAACYGLHAKAIQPATSEDCLYLNVYTPKEPNANSKIPVMVFMHGGGFKAGTGNYDCYGPNYLVPQGVILVTINYRLAALGFLSFNNKECPGNFGLKDQVVGLKWIRDNISAFGGDPNNVTIFGESAGGAMVHYHQLSPLSRGLFHKVIAQSGNAFSRWATMRYPVETGLALSKRLGCNTTDPSEAYKFIKNAKLEDIIINAEFVNPEIEEQWEGELNQNFSFMPTPEPEDAPDAFITKTARQAIADGDYADVPLIMGVNSREYALFIRPNDFVPPYTKDEDFQKMLPKELGVPLGSNKLIEAAGKLRKFYFPDGVTQDGYIRAMDASWFSYGMYKIAKEHTSNPKRESKDFLYEFDTCRYPTFARVLFNNQDIPGSAHGDELDFLFHPFRIIPGFQAKDEIEPGTRDANVQALMTRLWTDFAKTGIPSTDWPAAEASNLKFAHIAENIQIKENFRQDEMKLWDEIYELLESKE